MIMKNFISVIIIFIVIGIILWYTLTVLTDNYFLFFVLGPIWVFLLLVSASRVYKKRVKLTKTWYDDIYKAISASTQTAVQASLLLAVVVLIIGLSGTILKGIRNPVIFGLLIFPPGLGGFAFTVAAYYAFTGLVHRDKDTTRRAVTWFTLAQYCTILSLITIALLLILSMLAIGGIGIPPWAQSFYSHGIVSR